MKWLRVVKRKTILSTMRNIRFRFRSNQEQNFRGNEARMARFATVFEQAFAEGRSIFWFLVILWNRTADNFSFNVFFSQTASKSIVKWITFKLLGGLLCFRFKRGHFATEMSAADFKAWLCALTWCEINKFCLVICSKLLGAEAESNPRIKIKFD